MPLQNRVDPFGAIVAVPARGLFTGNRGVIHDPATRTLLRRRWTSRAWIVCALHYKQAHRDVMGRNAPSGGAGWTELFFLDEVTALAAGHRPCFACRREAAKDYAERFADAFGIAAPKVAEIDGHLHGERLASGGRPTRIAATDLSKLPDGAMVAVGSKAFAIRGGRALGWSFDGYDSGRDFEEVGDAGLATSGDAGLATSGDAGLSILTPATSLAVLRSGYRPAWHPSAA